jgi:hypothetical protein
LSPFPTFSGARARAGGVQNMERIVADYKSLELKLEAAELASPPD